MSARLAPSSRPLPLLFVAFLFLFVFPRPSPPWVINVIIIIVPKGEAVERKRKPQGMMMKTFITQRGESQGKTKKERKATKSKGRGLEEGG